MVSDVEEDNDGVDVAGSGAMGEAIPDKMAMSWQEELERVLSPRTPDSDRQVLLRDLFGRGPEIADEVQKAVVAGELESLIPDDGETKELLDDMDNVRRQVLDDILPEATTLLSDPTRAAEELQRGAADAATLAQDVAQAAPGAVAAFTSLLSDPERAVALVQKEARNLVSRTPEGLEMPAYSVVSSGAGYELREYLPCSVATVEVAAPLAGSGMGDTGGGGGSKNLSGGALAAYNSLVAYFLGANAQNSIMELTAPVRMDEANGATSGGAATMSLMVPTALSVSDAPAPTNLAVSLRQRGAEMVAVASFSGIATPGEVRRALARLREALDAAGVQEADEGTYALLQYNPPFTLPWLRRNEVTVPIAVAGGGGGATPPEAELAVEDSGKPAGEVADCADEEECGLPSD